jgi:hypothetical protein
MSTHHLPDVEAPRHRHAIPTEEGVARLSKIAVRRLNREGPHTVLAWLSSPSTGRQFGSEAAAVVARVIGGAR